MKSLTQLGDLIRVRPRPLTSPPEHEERVLALFRNRAELKKAYSELQDEVHRLQDRVKQQEGATSRVQEMLQALESRLGHVETAYPALVFYQLRALWARGRETIEQFVAELVGQQEERERRAHFAEVNRRLFARRKKIEAQLRSAETELAETRERCAELELTRARLTRFWHYFKRRDVERRLSAARAQAGLAEQGLADARTAAEQLEQEPAPEFEGLSVEARRAINIAAIAYAEVLCVRLSRTRLVMLAKEAASRREAFDGYGERAECEALIGDIARAREQLTSKLNVAQDVKTRSERLKQVARYRNPADTAPMPESVAFGDDPGEPGAAVALPNVLAEDIWDLFRVLLR